MARVKTKSVKMKRITKPKSTAKSSLLKQKIKKAKSPAKDLKKVIKIKTVKNTKKTKSIKKINKPSLKKDKKPIQAHVTTKKTTKSAAQSKQTVKKRVKPLQKLKKAVKPKGTQKSSAGNPGKTRASKKSVIKKPLNVISKKVMSVPPDREKNKRNKRNKNLQTFTDVTWQETMQKVLKENIPAESEEVKKGEKIGEGKQEVEKIEEEK